MNPHERPNQNNKKSITEHLEEINPSRRFFDKNKKEISPSQNEFKPNDKNEFIPLTNEPKQEDIKERIPEPIKCKSKDKNENIPLQRDDDKNKRIHMPIEDKEKDKNEINPLQRDDDKTKLIHLRIEDKEKDKNEIIPLKRDDDKNKPIHLPKKDKKKDKNEIIPLQKNGNKNKCIHLPKKDKGKDKNKIIPSQRHVIKRKKIYLFLEDKEKDKNKVNPLQRNVGKKKNIYLHIKDKEKNKNEIVPNKNEGNVNLQNHCDTKNNNANNSSNQSSLKENNKNTFPIGTDFEEQLSQYFQYFNVFWYDPNNTSDYELFKKSFEKVEFYRGYDLRSTINFFQQESVSEWIVITPGFQGEELIMKLENFKCIKYFFVYCENAELHESWAKKYKKIVCLTSDPEILCLKFIEINDYFIPNFNYECKENIDLSDLSKNYNSSKLKMFIKMKTIGKNKYNKLCIKILKYLDGDNIINDMKGTSPEKKSIFNLVTNQLRGIGGMEEQFVYQINIPIIKNIALLSLYFNKYPYLLNLLTFQEVIELFKKPITLDNIMIHLLKLISFHELCEKIYEDKSILDEKEKLKEMQITVIYILHYCLDTKYKNINTLLNYYQIINYFRDIDFCLKFFLFNFILLIDNKTCNFFAELTICLNNSEHRYSSFSLYASQIGTANNFKEEEQVIIKDTLTIKDFIIIGDKTFHEKIKEIESVINPKTIKYLNFEEITNYLEPKEKENSSIIRTYFYFLIIRPEEYFKNFEKIFSLSYKTGIIFFVFLYIENEKDIKINKIIINSFIPTILVYSPKDIIEYLFQKLNLINYLDYLNIEGIKELSDVKIPKITFEQNEEDKYKDGCFELAETFDINLITKKIIYSIGMNIDYLTEFYKDIYYIYQEHNALDIFFKQNCLFFGWYLYPELINIDICFVKRLLYLYCREEKPSEKSFYRIINDDLRTRDPHKIYRYINILAFINGYIQNGELTSFKGKVYRATKLDEKLILKLIPGTKMVNTTFWSTSKEFEIAQRFMVRNDWRNTYIVCKTVKNNIDLDLEQLNPYNEKEVLFLPFTEFIVENISSEIKYGKKIYTINLIESDNKNILNTENLIVNM